MVQDTPSRKLDQYIVRMPDGMREQLKDAAAKNGRSMNAEIVSRLEETLNERRFPDLSGAGFAAIVKVLEASVEGATALFFDIREEAQRISPATRLETKWMEPAIQRMCEETGKSRSQVVTDIMADWLVSNGHISLDNVPEGSAAIPASELARYWGVLVRDLRTLIDNGELAGHTEGRQLIVDRKSAEDFIAKNRTGSEDYAKEILTRILEQFNEHNSGST